MKQVCRDDQERRHRPSLDGPKLVLSRNVLGAGIVSLDTQVPGNRVAVVCSVHGNEPCGRAGLRRVLDTHELRSGALVIIDANPEASLLDQRFVSADLNRMFTDSLQRQPALHHELARAQYLARVIPELKLDYAVDIHSTGSASRFPFAVGFDGSETIMQLSPTSRIFGWNSDFMAGTLVEWLCRQGIPTATIECGQHRAPEAVDVSERALLSVLSHFGLICLESPLNIDPQQSFEIKAHISIRDAPSFRYTKTYSSFDVLGPGETIAHDSSGPYVAPDEAGFSILMPGDQKAINEGRTPEAYYLIKANR